MVEHALELELAHAAFEGIGVLLDIGCGGFVVFGFGQVQQFRRVRDGFRRAVYLFQLGGQLGAFAA